MICKLCSKDKKLINAHIIPESFFRFLSGGINNSISPMLISDWDKYPKRSPIGIYDNQILCAECDHFLGILDDYGKHFLIDGDFSRKTMEGEGIIVLPSEVNYSKLKLFCLSILWRAHHSTRREFSKINIGEQHERRIYEMLINSDVGTEDEYSIFLGKWGEGELETISDHLIQTPYSCKFDGVNYSIFYISNGIIIFIKVDKRSTPSSFGKIILRPDVPFYIVNRGDFTKSKEFSSFVSMVVPKMTRSNP